MLVIMSHQKPEPLNASTISHFLTSPTRQQIAHIDTHDTLDSTITQSWQLSKLADRQDKIFAVMAEQQTAGRGRRGRPWQSPAGYNIYLSLYWPFQCPMQQLQGLSTVTAISLCQALHTIGFTGVAAKWPNDLLHNHKKLAGVLIELNSKSQAVISTGINVHLPPEVLAEIDQPTTCLTQITSMPIKRNVLIATTLNQLCKNFSQLQQHGFASFLPLWPHINMNQDKPVSIITDHDTVEGIDRGIDSQGNVRLETSQGIQTFAAGEVSLRASHHS